MKLHHQKYGSGSPLIILHGMFGSLDNWRSLSRSFGDHFTVYSVDQRNHGKSPHHDLMTYELMSEDLREFMDDANVSSAYILGHSMGGKTAMQFALTYPKRVDKLVVADIAPKAYPARHDHILESLCSLDLGLYMTRSELGEALSYEFPEERVRHFLLTNVKREPDGSFSWKINLAAIQEQYDGLNVAIGVGEHAFSKPTLFVKGGLSGFILPEDERAIKEVFPSAVVKTIEGAGHWLHAERPEEFFSTTLDFLLQ